MERCAECGYDYDALSRGGLAPGLADVGSRLAACVNRHTPAALRAHTRAGVWSPLEYACHVRDLVRVQTQRIAQARLEEQPTFTPMRREERVTEDRYNEQDPTRVADEIMEAALVLAGMLLTLEPGAWDRTAVYNWPTRQVRTVEWIVRHTIHEGEHHLLDIERLLAAEPGSAASTVG